MDFINFQILTFLTVTLVLTVTPGIDTVLIMRNVLRGGRQDGNYTAIGICSGLFVHASLSALGLSVILANSAVLFHYLKILGAFYLIWLGATTLYGAFRRNTQISLRRKTVNNTSVKPLRSFREGIFSNLLNPKPAIFYFAFFPQFIGTTDPVFIKTMILASVQFLIGVSWLILLSHLIMRMKSILEKPLVGKLLNGVSGGVLVLLGVKLGLEDA